MEVGLFGGSFDPPHVGHLIVAQDALEKLGLDRVRFVPARVSPFKTDEAPPAPAGLRLAMLRAALGDHPGFEVDGSELERDGPSYTIDTVRILAGQEPGVRWTLLLGEDQWTSFHRWRSARELAALTRVVVLTRAGEATSGGPGPALPHERVEVTRVDLSSTGIRARVREGRSIRYLVPDPVRALIEANGLYETC